MALADLRHAFRLLRLHPGSSAAIVLTLGLAIGANSALFTLINAALLAPLPIERADRFVNVYTTGPDGTGYGALSYPDFLDMRAADSSLDDALGYSGLMTTVTDGRSSEVIFGELVTANYFARRLPVWNLAIRSGDPRRDRPDPRWRCRGLERGTDQTCVGGGGEFVTPPPVMGEPESGPRGPNHGIFATWRRWIRRASS
jgi:hypothetical protein